MDDKHNDNVTILVVDDEPNIVELLTVSLKFQGFNVHTANSGTEALRIARRQGLAGARGIPAPSTRLYLPNNLMRECLAVCKNLLVKTM